MKINHYVVGQTRRFSKNLCNIMAAVDTIETLNLEGARMEEFREQYAENMTTIDGALSGLAETKTDSIKVCVRIRPAGGDDESAWTWDRQTVMMVRSGRRNSTRSGGDEQSYDINLPVYSFDYLFHPEDDNAQIYSDLGKGIVSKSLEGYHGCIFTYGQTASGKTFTMNGTARSPGEQAPNPH